MSTDLTERWAQVWAEKVNAVERSTGVPADDWRIGGRRTKANPEGENLGWWQHEGLRQVESYIDWYRKSNWQIATMPDGKPGIEWEAEVVFGSSRVRLIVDAIYIANNAPWMDATPEQMVIVDYKTGSRTPAGAIQLGLYASAVEQAYGIRPKWGAYFMSRKGTLDDLIDLSPWSVDFFAYEFDAMQAFMDTGYFPPSVGDHCGYCSFRDYCVAVGGSRSSEYPLQIRKAPR